VPPDSVRCTRGLQLKLVALGNFQRQLRYNSPDMSGAPRKGGLRNSPASGFHSSRSAIIRRTVRCTPDCPVHLRSNGYFRRQRLPAAHLLRASAHRSQTRPCWRTGHSTVHVRCATGHQGGPRSQNSNGQFPTALVTWRGHRTVRCAPDCPVCHRTDGLLKGKCALGPFLSILVIECQHKCLNVNQCPWMNKVQI
jgi:hypothetical protein